MKHAQMVSEKPQLLVSVCQQEVIKKTFAGSCPECVKGNQRQRDTLSWYPGAGTIHGTAGLAESLEAKGHPSGAWRADHTLLLPYRPQDVWQGQGTDGGVYVCVCQCFHRRDSWICQVQVQGI